MGCAGSSQVSHQSRAKPVAHVYPKQQHVMQQHVVVGQRQQQNQQVVPVPIQQNNNPAPSVQPTEQEDKTDIEIKPVDINEQILKRYVELESVIQNKEKKNILRNYKVKCKEKEDLDETVKQLDEHYKQCTAKTAKEKADVDNLAQPTVRSFFKDQAHFDATFTKEQEEYLAALNLQEMAKKDLDGVRQQRNKLALELGEMKGGADQLFGIYKEQDELLASLFDGKYGSSEENKLEKQLDHLLDRKRRIGATQFRWHNSRILMHHACNQLAFACRRWREILHVEARNTEIKYTMATEARNNITAAVQNISSTHRYLNGIRFPYCTMEEVTTLSRAVANIYVDMQDPNRHAHALKCYETTHRRSAALIQWFDSVMTKTIQVDLQQAVEQLRAKEKDLREERLKLIMNKIREVLPDTNIDLAAASDLPDMPITEESEPENTVDVIEADKVSIAGDQQINEETGEEAKTDTTPETAQTQQTAAAEEVTALSLDELAPPPSQEDLFGNIEEIKKQHEQDMAEFEKAQDMNKARMQQGLEEKLRARRSRKARQEAHNKEETSLLQAQHSGQQ